MSRPSELIPILLLSPRLALQEPHEHRKRRLVLPYAAEAVLGKGGAAAVLLLMFLSCTSAISAQLVGVSTVIAYDVYKTYLNPAARPSQILFANHVGV